MLVRWPKPLQRQWHEVCRDGWPHERYACLIGRRVGDLYEIESLFIPAQQAAHSSRNYIETPDSWIADALDEAAQEAAQIIGDIHSHPRTYRNWRGAVSDCVPSEGDYAAGWLQLCGITVASEQRSGRIRCRTRFYPPAPIVQVL